MDSYARYYRRYRSARLRALVIISFAILQFPLAVSASLVAIPSIADDLNVNAVWVSWIPAVFLLASLVSQLPGGRLSDLIGLKKAFMGSTFIFALGSLIAGLSLSIEVLLIARVMQGMAGAILASAGMAMISRIYAAGGRGAALGWMTSAIYFGMTAGPLLGGWLVDQFGWRSVFILPIPILACVMLGLRLSVPGEWISAEKHRIDWLGTSLFAGGIVLLFYGSTQLVNVWGITSSVLGVFIIYLFVRWSRRVNFPLVNIDVMVQNKPFIRSVFAAFFMYSSQYGIVLILALYLQYNRGLSPTDTGQLMMLQALMMTVCAPIAGRLSDRLGHRLLATSGSLAIALGLFALTCVGPSTPLWTIGVAIMVIGFGHGLFSTPNNASALGAIPPDKIGIGSAIVSLARQSGQLLGTAVISLLLAFYFAGAVIGDSDPSLLAGVTTHALSVSLLLALLAAWFSWKRV